MNGWTDGATDGLTDGPTDGPTNRTAVYRVSCRGPLCLPSEFVRALIDFLWTSLGVLDLIDARPSTYLDMNGYCVNETMEWILTTEALYKSFRRKMLSINSHTVHGVQAETSFGFLDSFFWFACKWLSWS